MADVAPALPEFSIGDRMRKAREAAGIGSTDRMAELLNAELEPKKPISGSTVAAWERGANQPRRMADVVNAWANICTREGKGRGVKVTRGWLWGVAADSLANSSEKSERGSHLRKVADNANPQRSAKNRTALVLPVPALT